MRCSKVFMYLFLRLQQICCFCCMGRRWTRTYSETTAESEPADEFGGGGGGDSTIDLENVDGLGTLPPIQKINLDYDEDDAYAKYVKRGVSAAATTNRKKGTIIMQATDRNDWLNDDLFSGEKAVTIICTAFGPLQLAHPVSVNGGTGRIVYTVTETAENTGVIAAWEDQSRWASVAALFENRQRVIAVAHL